MKQHLVQQMGPWLEQREAQHHRGAGGLSGRGPSTSTQPCGEQAASTLHGLRLARQSAPPSQNPRVGFEMWSECWLPAVESLTSILSRNQDARMVEVF